MIREGLKRIWIGIVSVSCLGGMIFQMTGFCQIMSGKFCDPAVHIHNGIIDIIWYLLSGFESFNPWTLLPFNIVDGISIGIYMGLLSGILIYGFCWILAGFTNNNKESTH